MIDNQAPLVIEPQDLEKHLSSGSFLLVDLCQPETYARAHIPGAVHLDYAQIVTARPPVMGLLPNREQLSATFSGIGLTPDRHVVAYDDEGGGKACRLLWTLAAIGHPRYSLLDGGIQAWAAEHLPTTTEIPPPGKSRYSAGPATDAVVTMDYIVGHLGQPDIRLLDCRTPGEYSGQKRLAARAGHIPGAVNFDWVEAMDQRNHLRLKPAAELRRMLDALGVTPDKRVITYCQTHHRSAHTFIVLKSLGFTQVAGYPGSWSEWGNSADTPVE